SRRFKTVSTTPSILDAFPAPAGEAAPSRPRAAIRIEHQAIVVIERRMGRQGDPKGEQMIPGWQWVLGNARVGGLFDQLFAEARLTWSSLVCPEEQQATFAAVDTPAASHHT